MNDEKLTQDLEKTHRFIDQFNIPRLENNQPLSLTVRLARLLQKLGIDPDKQRAQQQSELSN